LISYIKVDACLGPAMNYRPTSTDFCVDGSNRFRFRAQTGATEIIMPTTATMVVIGNYF